MAARLGSRESVRVKDDDDNPATSLRDAKELVQQDHVMAIVGDSSIVDASWASYVASKGIPVVGGASFETTFSTNPDFYASGTQLLVNQFDVAQIAKAEGGTHLGVFYCAEAATCAELVPLVSAAAKLYGLKLSDAKVSATAPSYAAPCLAAKSAGVDVLYVGDNASVIQRVVDGCAQEGFKPKIVNTGAGLSNTFLKDSVLDGSKIAAYDADAYDTSNPGVAVFQSALKKYAPSLMSNPDFNPDAIYPWAGGQLFLAAAKAAHIGPTSTPADVKKGLYALKGETLDGIAPPLTYTPGKPAFVTCSFSLEISGGKYAPLNGDKPNCLTATQAKEIAAAAGG